MGENTPLFLGQVDCLGSETQLIECMNTTTKSDCSNAGVTCEKSSSEIIIIIKTFIGLKTLSCYKPTHVHRHKEM